MADIRKITPSEIEQSEYFQIMRRKEQEDGRDFSTVISGDLDDGEQFFRDFILILKIKGIGDDFSFSLDEKEDEPENSKKINILFDELIKLEDFKDLDKKVFKSVVSNWTQNFFQVCQQPASFYLNYLTCVREDSIFRMKSENSQVEIDFSKNNPLIVVGFNEDLEFNDSHGTKTVSLGGGGQFTLEYKHEAASAEISELEVEGDGLLEAMFTGSARDVFTKLYDLDVINKDELKNVLNNFYQENRLYLWDSLDFFEEHMKNEVYTGPVGGDLFFEEYKNFILDVEGESSSHVKNLAKALDNQHIKEIFTSIFELNFYSNYELGKNPSKEDRRELQKAKFVANKLRNILFFGIQEGKTHHAIGSEMREYALFAQKEFKHRHATTNNVINGILTCLQNILTLINPFAYHRKLVKGQNFFPDAVYLQTARGEIVDDLVGLIKEREKSPDKIVNRVMSIDEINKNFLQSDLLASNESKQDFSYMGDGDFNINSKRSFNFSIENVPVKNALEEQKRYNELDEWEDCEIEQVSAAYSSSLQDLFGAILLNTLSDDEKDACFQVENSSLNAYKNNEGQICLAVSGDYYKQTSAEKCFVGRVASTFSLISNNNESGFKLELVSFEDFDKKIFDKMLPSLGEDDNMTMKP